MITEPKMYGLKCDNCGIDHESGAGFAAMSDNNYMRDDALDAGWYNQGDNDYCPKCHEFNDEDELIIKS